MSFQDMPPSGGFNNINIERTFAKPWMRQGFFWLGMAGLTVNGYFLLGQFRIKNKVLRMEQMEHFIAAEPFLIAEAERKLLIHLRNSREEERELMKDVPNWVVGTLYGEPIFKTLPKDTLPPLSPMEFTGHRPASEWRWKIVVPDHRD